MILKEIRITINKYCTYILANTSRIPRAPSKPLPWGTQSAYIYLLVRMNSPNNFYTRHILSFVIFVELLSVEVHYLEIFLGRLPGATVEPGGFAKYAL